MKMNRIATAVLLANAAAAAHAQSNVQVYGIMDAGFTYTEKVATGSSAGRLVGIDSGLLQSSRWGLRGSESLGGDVSATFGLEQGVSLDSGVGGTSTRAWSRRSTVGLNSKSIGVLELGWRKDFLDEVGNAYGSVTPFGTFILKGSVNNLNRASGGSRASNMVYVTTANLSGFKANATVGLGETSGNWKAGTTFGAGASYASGGLSIGGGYWRSQRGTGAGTTSSDQAAPNSVGCNGATGGAPGDVCLTTWTLGASWNTDAFLVRGMYSLVKHPLVTAPGPSAPAFATTFTSTLGTGAFTSGGPNNTRGRLLDIGADYRLGSAGLLKASLIESRYDFLGASSQGKVRQLTVGGEYYLSRRTTLYATAATQSADAMYTPGILAGTGPGRDDTTTAIAAGIRHTF
jgi:predicted porin